MREQLMDDITMILINAGMDPDLVKSKMIIALSNYEITQRCTEVAVADEDDITKYLRMFLVNKRVSGRTEKTLKCYKDTMKRFFEEVRKSPLEITSDDIKLYLATKEIRDGASKVYQKDMLRVISSFFQWMTKEEHILRNPMNKVDNIKTPKVKKEAFTELQIEKMRLEIKDDKRLMCIFEILLSTWCRVSELCDIKLSDISEDMESVLIHGKGEKDRICYINARAKICMQEYLRQRRDNNPYLFAKCNVRVNDEGKVFASECKKHKVKAKEWWKVPELISNECIDKSVVEQIVRKLGKRSGVEKVHPHRFRRTGATFALRRGMPIEQVSKLLGHESIETTQIYLDISEKELEQAHKKYV